MYFGSFGVSFYFLYLAFSFLLVSVAYVVWIEIGTAGAVLINMVFFGESKSSGKIINVIFIVIVVIGLKYVSKILEIMKNGHFAVKTFVKLFFAQIMLFRDITCYR